MKRLGLALSVAVLAISGATAYGYWGFCCGPSLSFGVGVGPFFGCSFGCSPGYCWSSPGYCYATARPGYAYYPAIPPVPASVQPVQAPPAFYLPAQPQAPDPSAWMPSIPGAGHWVPDSTPYRYTPVPVAGQATQIKNLGNPIVSILRSPEGIPVYIVSH